MNETRSLGIQCQSRKSVAVQTKRLSKEEMRYYTKIVDKEKQVLFKFLKATKEYPPIRQPHYVVNLSPTQTKLRRNYAIRKKRKNKTGKHSSHKKRHGKTTESIGHDEENTSHYVSKIVVDDATHCLKLRVRSCNAKKCSSEDLKENNNTSLAPERARSRKAKQPRRYNRSLESESFDEMENNCSGLKEMQHKSPKEKAEPLSSVQQQAPNNSREMASTKEIIKPERLEKKLPSPTTFAGKPTVKAEVKYTDCLLANKKPREYPSSPDTSPLPTMTSQLAPILPPAPSDEDSSDRHATSSDDDSNYHSPNEDSDDNQSVCSEEFFIVEQNEDNVDDVKESSETQSLNDVTETAVKTKEKDDEKKTNIEQADINLKNELKKRLKANLIRKAVDSGQHDNGNKNNMAGNERNMAGNERTMEGSEALPQVVSVHFYDPQSHRQRMVGPDTHLSQYPSYTVVHDPKSPSNTLPYPPLSPSAQKSSSATATSRPIPLPQPSLPGITSMNYPYPPYYQNATDIHKQYPTYQIPCNPTNASTKARSLPPEIASTSITTRGITSPNANIPHVRPYQPQSSTQALASPNISVTNVPTEISQQENLTHSISTQRISPSSANVPSDGSPHHPEMVMNNLSRRGVQSLTSTTKRKASSEKNTEITDIEERKRKRFIFGSHEPPKKKVISSLLTPLCEREATRLADGIHEINMQYFPLRSLAQKAAKRVSGDTDDVLKLIEQKIQLKTKIQDVEKARNLLKDIYDMVLKSKEIEDIQNFELVSHSFGVRNILNHLSLVDLYFGELGSELESKI